MSHLDIKSNSFGEIVHCFPEMVVHIYGTRIDEVSNVNFNFNLVGNSTCNITIISPRNRYVLTKQDLLNKWRKDKEKTKMIYETKLRSGNIITEGEPIFSVNDPVKIFLRGRYTNEWYLSFVGIINKPGTLKNYGSSETVILSVEDVTRLLRLSYSDTNPALLLAARTDNAVVPLIEQKEAESSYEQDTAIQGRTLVEIMDRLILGKPLPKRLKDIQESMQEELEKYEKEKDDTYSKYIEVTEKIRKLREDIAISYSNNLEEEEYGVTSNINSDSEAQMSFLEKNQNKLLLEFKEKKKKYDQVKTEQMQRAENAGLIGYEKIGSSGFFRKIFHLYKRGTKDKNSFTPFDIYKGLVDKEKNGQNKKIMRRFPTGYNINEKGLISPSKGIKKDSLYPIFTETEIKEMENLKDIWMLSSIPDNSDTNLYKWMNSSLSPDAVIKGEVTGLWENELFGKYYNPRFILIAQKEFAEGKTIKKGLFRNLSVSTNEMKSKLTLINEGLSGIDFNFHSTPCGDLICEPFWDDTDPHDWNKLFLDKEFNVINKSRFVYKDFGPRGLTQRQGNDSNKAFVYVSFKQDLDSPLIVESKETSSKSWGITPNSIKTYVEVKGDSWNNSDVAPEAPTTALLMGFGAYGRFSANGFEEKKLTRKEIEKINTFKDLVNNPNYRAESDLVRMYGFQSIFVNTRLTDDSESSMAYARTLFKRFYGDAFELSVSHAYKPEMLWWLGKPIYVRDLRVIAMLKGISFSFTYGRQISFKSSFYRVRRQFFRFASKVLPYSRDEYYKTSEDVVKKIDEIIISKDLGIFPKLSVVDLEEIGLSYASQEKFPSKSDVIANLTLFNKKYLGLGVVLGEGTTYAIISKNTYIKDFSKKTSESIVNELRRNKYSSKSNTSLKSHFEQINSYLINHPEKAEKIKTVTIPIDAYDSEGNYSSFIKEIESISGQSIAKKVGVKTYSSMPVSTEPNKVDVLMQKKEAKRHPKLYESL